MSETNHEAKRRAHDIRVEVETAFVPAQSDPEKGQYVFAYTITIRNRGTVAARLLRRHWIISDADGRVQEVEGEGVVGEQPYLRPGEDFQYTSGTRLDTPIGTMRGSYRMHGDDGAEFDAAIPAFVLAAPRVLH